MTDVTTGALQPLLEVRRLAVEYRRRRRTAPLRAVDGVDLAVGPGRTLGIVGESGSGKTTLARAILGLVPIHDGRVLFGGRDITHATRAERRAISDDLQVVFQDPYSSLNPTRTVHQTLAEMLRGRGLATGLQAERVTRMLERVGLPQDAAHRYPQQFSGGQRQRIAIARALMRDPRLVICDEAVSALDLSVQAQILNLLRDLQDQLDLSYLFIAHDLTIVRHVCDHVAVMYRGRVMESGPADVVFQQPSHPYTRDLLAAAPVPDPPLQRVRRGVRPTRPSGGAPSLPATGCPYRDRCPYAIDRCGSERPLLDPTGTGALAACHRWQDLPRPTTTAPPARHHEENTNAG